jgi:threonine dehydratase
MPYPTQTDLETAFNRVKPHVYETPILTSQGLNEMTGATLFFKCENFQKTGSFKMRGATNAILSLDQTQLRYGVATQSSGNHGQAVAFAAQSLGIPAYIVMPKNSAQVKIDAVKAYNGTVIFCEPTLAARETAVEKIIAETQAHYIPPYNDERIIAGQATAALEIFKQVQDLDFLVAPVGGGGLISGTALAAHYFSPQTKVIAGEPLEANDAYRSLQTGIMQENTTTNTIADGLRASIREKTFEVIQKYVHEIVCVEEKEIIEAMKLIWTRLKIVVEPSCAVPLAAVLFEKSQKYKGKRIGIILTGGNIDIEKLAQLL